MQFFCPRGSAEIFGRIDFGQETGYNKVTDIFFRIIKGECNEIL